MEKVYIGKIVSTHGIKGELRIISDFPFKNKVFTVGKKILVDNHEYVIRSYRIHKKFDMICLDDYDDINDVLFLLKKKIYVKKDELELDEDEVLDEEFLQFRVITTTGMEGTVTEVFSASPDNKILRVLLDHEVLIPLSSPMIKEIHKKEKYLVVELIDGM